MKGIISTTFLGILDYITSILLIASPWLFGFSHVESAAAVFMPIFLGAMQLIMTIFSKYKFGIIKVFPMPMHLFLNGFVGFLLLVSPFLYGFAHIVYLPHVIIGLVELSMGLYTDNSAILEED